MPGQLQSHAERGGPPCSPRLMVEQDDGGVFRRAFQRGGEVDTDTFVEVTKDELENVALESTRTIEIDEFVEKSENPRYLIRPDGKVGHDAFAVIRETIREMGKVAIGRVVLTNREHIIALEPLDRGLMGTLHRRISLSVLRTSDHALQQLQR